MKIGEMELDDQQLEALVAKSIRRSMKRMAKGEFRCGTPFLQSLNRAVKDYKAGNPLDERYTLDEVEMTVYDEWIEVGRLDDSVLYAPLFSIDGGDTKERFVRENGVDGFIPLRGHEYKLKVRRIYQTDNPHYHYYELLEVISDTAV